MEETAGFSIASSSATSRAGRRKWSPATWRAIPNNQTDRIDVVLLDKVPIELAHHIIAAGKLLYQKVNYTRVEYEDICHRIIALENARKPSDYYEAILMMGELGILSPDFARKLAPLAGF